MTFAVLGFTVFVFLIIVAVVVGKKMDEREGK
jgi:hypothetical protein